MNQRNYLAAYLLVVFGIVLLSNRVESAQLINDRVITVQSDREIAVKRRALIQYLWGKEEFPRRLPIVLTNIASPVKQLTNVVRVDRFRIEMTPGLQGLAYHSSRGARIANWWSFITAGFHAR